MKKTLAITGMVGGLLFSASTLYVSALEVPECNTSSFDTFATGSVNGQFGWYVTGDFDQEIVPNTYGFASFGCKSLRISDATTSVLVYPQTFSAPSVSEAGETDAVSNGTPREPRQNRFEAQFDLASTRPDEQPGMNMSVSPDRGDGLRMSSLGFDDTAHGIDVYFHDFVGTESPLSLTETKIATGLSRSNPHTFKFLIDFIDGTSNDIVKIFIDGELAHTGTSWENYYRYDEEVFPFPNNTSRTVNSLVFHERHIASSTDMWNGYLIDNVSVLATSTPDTASTSTPPAATTTPEITTSTGGAGGPNGVPGCRDVAANNYDPTAIYDGPCTYTPSGGYFINEATTTPTGGEVLGVASTSLPLSCGEYLTLQKGVKLKALRPNGKNDARLVTLLQRYLNEYVESNLPITGTFGPRTASAVKKMQTSYKDAILVPWKLTKPTGIVYITTVAHINNTKCPTLNIKVSQSELVPATE